MMQRKYYQQNNDSNIVDKIPTEKNDTKLNP